LAELDEDHFGDKDIGKLMRYLTRRNQAKKEREEKEKELSEQERVEQEKEKERNEWASAVIGEMDIFDYKNRKIRLIPFVLYSSGSRQCGRESSASTSTR
jgi:hypothetical protein